MQTYTDYYFADYLNLSEILHSVHTINGSDALGLQIRCDPGIKLVCFHPS